MILDHRRHSIAAVTNSVLTPGSNYTVKVLPEGGIAKQSSTGATIHLYEGHGFVAGQKIMVGLNEDKYSGTYSISTTSTSGIVLSGGAFAVSPGDRIINLGADTGTTAPNYDDTTISVYTTPDATTLAPNRTVTANSGGEYEYWHSNARAWELVRSGDNLVDLIPCPAPAKFEKIINVKDYGATGDGTTDDTNAIQNALSDVPSTGATVYFPAGTYIINTAIWIKSYTHVQGAGIDVSVIKRKANTLISTTAAINTNACLICGPSVGTAYSNANPGYSIMVSDLTIDGNYTNQTYSSPGNGAHGFKSGQLVGSDTGGCIDGLTLRGMKVTNTMQDGISVTNCRNLLIDGCITYKTGQCSFVAAKNGISLSGGSTDIANGWCINAIISNCRISYSGDATYRTAEGIANTTWSNVTIIGNDISHVDYGVEQTWTSAGSGYTIRNIKVIGNTIHDLTDTTTRACVGVAGSLGTNRNCYGFVVANNSFYNINNCAIYLGSRIHDVVISNNSIKDCNLDGTQATYNLTIATFDNDGYVIEGNIIDNNVQFAGVAGIVSQSYGAAINNGIIANNRIKGCSSYGIIISAGDYDNTNCLVTNNHVISGICPIRVYDYGTGTHSGHRIRNNYATGYSSTYLWDNTSMTGFDISDLARTVIDGWYQDNVTTNQTNVALTRTPSRWVAPRAGSITGVVVKSTEARTAGTLTVTVYKNTGLSGATGSTTGFTAVLDGTNTSYKASVQAPYLDTFNAGDELYAVVTTDASWQSGAIPNTADIRVSIEVEI